MLADVYTSERALDNNISYIYIGGTDSACPAFSQLIRSLWEFPSFLEDGVYSNV